MRASSAGSGSSRYFVVCDDDVPMRTSRRNKRRVEPVGTSQPPRPPPEGTSAKRAAATTCTQTAAASGGDDDENAMTVRLSARNNNRGASSRSTTAAVAKSAMFMNSPSSVYAAVSCNYDTLLDGLHGGECVCSNCDADSGRGGGGGGGGVRGYVERSLIMIHIHFGSCPIFEEQFDNHLSNCERGMASNDGGADEFRCNGEGGDSSGRECGVKKGGRDGEERADERDDISSLTPAAIEEAVNRSVRHLCDRECFRRAYCAMREFAFLWRDVEVIDGDDEIAGGADSDCGGGNEDQSDDVGTAACVGKSPPAPSSPSRRNARRRRPTKEELFSGWGCRVLPPPFSTANSKISEAAPAVTPVTQSTGKKRKRAATNMPSQLVFVSPNGTEIETRAKAVKIMNDSYFSSSTRRPQRETFMHQNIPMTSSSSTTPLIETTARINQLYSPFGLLEELFLDDPWKLLVSTICLNVTTRIQVDRALHNFLRRYPTAESTADADWMEITPIISTLGLGTKRAKGLVRFSREYLELVNETRNDPFTLEEEEVKGLHFVGEYGWTAYKVFIRRELPKGKSVKVCDHALQLYVEYQLGRRLARCI